MARRGRGHWYQIRVFTGSGRLVLTRETADTGASLPADSLSAQAVGEDLYLEVGALDRLSRPVASSRLAPLRTPDSGG